jgi:(p)ppGpp synthase/HD superfamily hydrolase
MAAAPLLGIVMVRTTRPIPTPDLTLVLSAADFAAVRHRDQRRKGSDREPYVNHLIEVAHHLSKSADGHDPVLLAAGFLHDTVEDTDTTLGELDALFGPDIAHVVAEVTDDKTLRKDERKRLQVATITTKSRRAQLLSIADKTANLRSLVRDAPTDWTRGRIVEYGAWAERVVGQIRGQDAYLDGVVRAALDELQRRYGV